MNLIKELTVYFLKVILTFWILYFMIVLAMALSSSGIISAGRLAKGINQESISSIELGMSKCEVTERLGIPFDSSETYILSSKGEVEPESIVITYNYSKPGFLWDIKVFVSFNSNDEVIYVNMRKGGYDFFVYDAKHPNKIINFETYNRVIPKVKKEKGRLERSGDANATPH